MIEPDKAAGEAQLISELGIADSSADNLADTIDRLYARLEPVIREEPEEDTSPSEIPQLVDRANRVRDIRDKIDRSAQRLQRLHGLIEV